MLLIQEMTAILITLRTKKIKFKYLYLVCVDHIGVSNTSETPSLFNVRRLYYMPCFQLDKYYTPSKIIERLALCRYVCVDLLLDYSIIVCLLCFRDHLQRLIMRSPWHICMHSSRTCRSKRARRHC